MEDFIPLNPIQRRVLQFFYRNPQAVETPRGIHTWLGLESQPMEEALKDLVARKWLEIHEASAVIGYTLTTDARRVAEVRKALGDA